MFYRKFGCHPSDFCGARAGRRLSFVRPTPEFATTSPSANALQLPPLTLPADDWRYPAAATLETVIADALAYARKMLAGQRPVS